MEYDMLITFLKKNTEEVINMSTTELAVKKALGYCVEHNILADFLKENAEEVVDMLTTEFDINIAERIWKEEAMEKGIEIGRKEGMREKTDEILQFINQGYTVEQIKAKLSDTK